MGCCSDRGNDGRRESLMRIYSRHIRVLIALSERPECCLWVSAHVSPERFSPLLDINTKTFEYRNMSVPTAGLVYCSSNAGIGRKNGDMFTEATLSMPTGFLQPHCAIKETRSRRRNLSQYTSHYTRESKCWFSNDTLPVLNYRK